MVDGHLGPVRRELDTSADCLAGAHLRGGVGGRGTGGGAAFSYKVERKRKKVMRDLNALQDNVKGLNRLRWSFVFQNP